MLDRLLASARPVTAGVLVRPIRGPRPDARRSGGACGVVGSGEAVQPMLARQTLGPGTRVGRMAVQGVRRMTARGKAPGVADAVGKAADYDASAPVIV